MEQLADRVAVVTGGGNGIGRAMAITFAREGMDVVVADILLDAAERVAEEVRAEGRRSLAVGVDVGDRKSVEQLAGQAYAEFRATHVLCNNAGIVGNTPLTEYEDDNWRWMVRVNLWGVVYGLQTFLPRMLAQEDDCHIVNTASVAGLYTGGGRSGAYTGTKYAVVGMSESLYHELEHTRIGVSVLCPTTTRTDIFHNTAVNRPVEFGGPRRSRGTIAELEASGQAWTGLMDPFFLAQPVVRSIREKRLYIVGDGNEVREGVNERFQKILADVELAASDDP